MKKNRVRAFASLKSSKMVLAVLFSAWTLRALAAPIQVGSDGRVTVEGSFPSLRAVIEELCWRAHVALRFEVPDAPVTADIRDASFDQATQTLLAGRNYVLATERLEGSPPRSVRVLHVFPPGTAAGTASGVPFSLPSRLLDAAFAAPSQAERDAAIRELVDGIVSDPVRLQAFLAADVEVMRRSLAGYPGAREILDQIAASPQVDEPARAKLRALGATLPAPTAPDASPPPPAP